jgi:hypothetical protein
MLALYFKFMLLWYEVSTINTSSFLWVTANSPINHMAKTNSCFMVDINNKSIICIKFIITQNNLNKEHRMGCPKIIIMKRNNMHIIENQQNHSLHNRLLS